MSSLRTYLIAEPIFYGILLIPSILIAKRHGKPGYLGWGLATLLCVMHAAGGAMLLTGTRYGMTVLTNCAGVLLLASCGIWWEANHHLESLDMAAKIKVGVVHLLVLVGAALMAMNISVLSGRMQAYIACGCWGVAWLAASAQAIMSMKAHGGFGEPTQKLITASVLGVFCAGVRIIFTILARTRMVYGLHPRGGSFLMTLSCVFFPEALATLAFVVIGMMTHGIGG
ncbi:hypothetical protein ACHAO7_000091 [Fusarium culmorum]